MKGPLVLLTDFGGRDPYVGVMKGVILSRNPRARIVDLCHEVPPQDIRTAAFYLLTSAEFFPAGALFITVVDPGVGSKRRILWAKTATHQFLFPDNGCASWVSEKRPFLSVREVSNHKLWLNRPSSTFHGRDIFAAVGGSLSRGAAAASLGPKVKAWVRMPFPPVARHGQVLRGSVVAIDHFGNAITNLRAKDIRHGARVEFKGRDLSCVRTHYAQASDAAALALLGSSGFLELSIRNGHFAGTFQARPGDPVDVV